MEMSWKCHGNVSYLSGDYLRCCCLLPLLCPKTNQIRYGYERFLMMMALIGLVGNWNSTLTALPSSPDSLYLNEDLPEINIVAVKPLDKGRGG